MNHLNVLICSVNEDKIMFLVSKLINTIKIFIIKILMGDLMIKLLILS